MQFSSKTEPPSAPTFMTSRGDVNTSQEVMGVGWFADERGNLRLVNHVVKRPWCSCCSVLALCLMMTVLLVVIVIPEGNPITEDANEYDLFDSRSKAYDSFRLAKELVEEKRDERENGNLVELRQSKALDIVYWIFEAETEDGIFTKQGLEDMKKADDIMLAHKDWSSYCVLEHFHENGTQLSDGAVSCKKPISATTIFFPDSWDSDLAESVMERLQVQENVQLYNRMAPCLDHGELCEEVMSGVTTAQQEAALTLRDDINAITSQWTGEGELVDEPAEVALFCAYLKLLPTRAFLVDFYFDKNFNVSNPVSMYSRTILEFGGPLKGYKRVEENKTKQEKSLKTYVMDNLYDEMEAVSKRGSSEETNTFYFMTALLFDVFLKIIMQDTMLAQLSVGMVFAYLWYMLGSLFLSAVGMLEILLSIPCAWFIFRGIFQIGYFSGMNFLGIFIVAAIGADDIFVFMDAYRQSAHQGPEVNRDLATRMSWVWRKSGKAMAITSATTCMAFLSTCFSPIASTRSFGIFVSLVILWDYVLVMSLFCTAVVIYHNRFERPAACTVPFLCGCCTEGCACGNQRPTPTEQTLSSFHDGIDIPKDKVTSFFRTHFSDFVLSIKGRVLIALALVAWMIPAVVYVTKLEPTKTTEQFLREDHPLQYSITILNNEFPVSARDEGLPVFFVWGIDTLDQGGVNQLIDPEFIGEPVFKEDFAFSPTCQRKISEACDDLEYTMSEDRTSLLKREENGFSVLRCVTRSFSPFAAERGFTDGSVDQTVPLDRVNEAVKAYLSDLPAEVDDIDDIAENFGWDGERLRYVAIEVEAQELDQWNTMSEDLTRVQYDGFMELAKHLDSIVGDACGAPGVIMTDMDQKFVFMNNQKIYRQSAVQGACIGVAIAFAVLLLATRSPLLSALSTLCILCSIMSVIGLMVMMGWTLGTIEAILISILAGFSVDYVVHLAHAYAQSQGAAADRVRAAFGEMGTPVLSGMLTSVLASLPLFACQIVFFSKFGTFLCFTILFSWLFANFGFMALIATVGGASTPKISEQSTVDADADPEQPKPAPDAVVPISGGFDKPSSIPTESLYPQYTVNGAGFSGAQGAGVSGVPTYGHQIGQQPMIPVFNGQTVFVTQNPV